MKKIFYLSPLLLLLLFKNKNKKVKAVQPIKSDLSNKPSELFFSSKLDFVKKMLPIAKVIKKDYGIPYLFLLAQTALETRYGKSELVSKAANFAGIKQPNLTKPHIMALGFEDVKDPSKFPNRIKSKDKKLKNGFTRIYLSMPFAKFPTISDGLAGYIKILKLPRYQNAYKYKDVLGFATEIKKGGYATGVNYVKSIVDTSKTIEKLIKDNNL